MSEETGSPTGGQIKRRDLLKSAAALTAPAAFAPRGLGAQERRRSDRIRVGIVGAGGIVESTHLPGLRRVPNVEIVAVANRSLESSRRAAAALDIPRAYASWEELIAADGIDAVLIGTWPYQHKPITLAALESGRHVLCQARMAMNAAEAHEMLAASRRHPDLVCMLVPSSSGYSADRALLRLLGGDLLGKILSVDVHRLQRGFASFGGPLDWRHNPELSGINVLNVGAIYELMMRWLGPGNRVLAKTRVQIPTRRTEEGTEVRATIPDHVEVLYELEDGAPVHMVFSETTGLSRGNDLWIFGTEGTIRVDGSNNIFVGRRGDRELAAYPNPPQEQYRHRVEEEFINAIRGIEPVSMNTFDIGVRYMEWTEAVHRSAESGVTVSLPVV